MIFNALYGIRLQVANIKPGEAWNSDIYKLDVVHETEGLIGNIYCDFYDRPSKPHQDCHFTIVGGKEMPDGSYQVQQTFRILSAIWLIQNLIIIATRIQ